MPSAMKRISDIHSEKSSVASKKAKG